MSAAIKPNLFIIGASKTGSSALHAYLDYHPQIQMSRPKEPCFFVERGQLKEKWPVRWHDPVSHDLETYLGMFTDNSARYHGEASVYYSQYPHMTGVAERIWRFNPDARIIYIVRDPVTRAVAHYWQRAKEFLEPREMREAICAGSIYVDTSDYALQLRQYLEHFDRSAILIVSSEELRAHRSECLSKILDWLDLPRIAYTPEQLSERHVSPPTSRMARFGFVKHVRDSGVWAAVRSYLPKPARVALAKAGTVTFARASVDDAGVRQWLTAYFEPRVADFEALAGQSFHWLQAASKVPPAAAARGEDRTGTFKRSS